MTLRRAMGIRLPSSGFCVLISVHLGLAAYLLWGFAEPPLERVWELHHALKIGQLGRLERQDAELLRAAMVRHPSLAESLLGEGQLGLVSAHSRGWLETPDATALRTARAHDPCSMEVEARMPSEAFPVTIDVVSREWRARVVLQEPGTNTLSLPEGHGAAEVISLHTSTHAPHDDGETLGVRLGFTCQGRGPGQ